MTSIHIHAVSMQTQYIPTRIEHTDMQIVQKRSVPMKDTTLDSNQPKPIIAVMADMKYMPKYMAASVWDNSKEGRTPSRCPVPAIP